MKKIRFAAMILVFMLIFTACSKQDLAMVDDGREAAIEAVVTSKPGGNEIPEAYLDICYELSRLAAADWKIAGSPNGMTLEWTYLDANRSILGATSIALNSTYPNGEERVYSVLIYQ